MFTPPVSAFRKATLLTFAGMLLTIGMFGEAAAGPAVRVPAGSYTPQFRGEGMPARVEVPEFRLDQYPVTNAEFLAFVQKKPAWRRGEVPAVFAEKSYLQHWAGPLTLGPDAPPKAPVVNVSWFAARAYCKAQGKSLPTTDQWEYAAAADEKMPDAATMPAFYRQILQWYSRPTPKPLPNVGSTRKNLWGVWDLHGLVWEWVDDFSATAVGGGGRTGGEIDKQLFCAPGAVGAADFMNYASFMRYAFRSSLKANYAVKNLGFRCAE